MELLAAYRVMWARQAGLPAPPLPKPKVLCAHLGEPTGERRQCPTCSGTVLVKLTACTVHGVCSVGKKIDGIACCVDCSDYAEPTPPGCP